MGSNLKRFEIFQLYDDVQMIQIQWKLSNFVFFLKIILKILKNVDNF